MRNRRRWSARALPAVLLLTAGACGLNANDEPQAIPVENLPPGLLDPDPSSTTTAPGPPATRPVTVYLLAGGGDEERLAPVEREVGDPPSPASRLTALLSPLTPAETRRGLTSTIPADTVLLDAVVTSNEVRVNLSGEFFAIQGLELAKAYAQVVWSLTEIDGISRVRFSVEGQDSGVLDGEGVEKQGPVTRADYATLAPP